MTRMDYLAVACSFTCIRFVILYRFDLSERTFLFFSKEENFSVICSARHQVYLSTQVFLVVISSTAQLQGLILYIFS